MAEDTPADRGVGLRLVTRTIEGFHTEDTECTETRSDERSEALIAHLLLSGLHIRRAFLGKYRLPMRRPRHFPLSRATRDLPHKGGGVAPSPFDGRGLGRG